MSSDDKPFKATAKKLREARTRGEIVLSPEINSAAAFWAVTVLMVFAADYGYAQIREIVNAALKVIARGSALQLSDFSLHVHDLGWSVLRLMLPIGAVGALGAIVVGALQARGVVSITPVMPKFDRLDPVQGLKRIFSGQKLAELAKTLVMLLALGFVLKEILLQTGASATSISGISASDTLSFAGTSLKGLLYGAGGAFVVAAVADYGLKYYAFHEQHRMSRDEVRREYKENNGDPLVRSKRKALARELANAPVQQRVAVANVVVTNPTHFAVALQYDPETTPLPIVVAKGVDEQAAAIREAARRSGIPLYEDRPLARALYARVEEGDYIDAESVEAVANVFGWLFFLQNGVSDESNP